MKAFLGWTASSDGVSEVLAWLGLFLGPVVPGTAFLGTAAWAGGSTGGGYAVFCQEPSVATATVRTLDYYEAEILLPSLTLDLGAGTTETELALNVVQRLAKFDPDRAKDYEQKARDFLSDSHFVSVNIPEIKDYGLAPLGENCVLKQLAVQNLVPIPEGKKFTINKELWGKLSLTDKAGLILHEIIYEEALSLGQTDSRNSRYFNALISSKEFEKLTRAEYLARLKSVGLPESLGDKPDMGLGFPDVALTAVVKKAFAFDLTQYVLNPSGAPLRFSTTGSPGWLSIFAGGALMGTPTSADIGANTFSIQVSDGTTTTVGQVTLRVVRDPEFVLPTATVGVKFSYDFASRPSFDPACWDHKVKVVKGPGWLKVSHGTVVGGTPVESDVGGYKLVVDFKQVCERLTSEEDPSTPGGMRTVHETVRRRETFEGQVESAKSAQGKKVPSGAYDEVVMLYDASGHGCQGTIVGPRVILTTSTCTTAGSTAQFQFQGKKYVAKMTPNPSYGSGGPDLALGVVSADIPGALPLNIGGKLAVGDTAELLAVTSADLYSYVHEVSSIVTDQYLSSEEKGLKSITFGNSAAPLIVGTRNKMVASIVVASNMGAPEVVYSERLDSAKSQAFLKTFATDNAVDICGVTKLCK